MMLFLFDKKNNAIIHPEAMQLTEHLKKVNAKQQSFIVLAYDYFSPLNQFEEPVRVQKACRRVFHSDDTSLYTGDKMQAAIEEYKSLQFDVERETIRTYRTKIIDLQGKLSREDNEKRVKDLINTIRMLNDEVNTITQRLVHREEEAAISGGGTLTFLERLKENKKLAEQEKERTRKQREHEAALKEATKTQIVDLDDEP